MMVLTVEQAPRELRDRARVLRGRRWVAGLPSAPGESCAMVDCERFGERQVNVRGLTEDAADLLRRHLDRRSVTGWNDEQPDVEHVAGAMEAAADAAERLGVLV